MAASPEEPAKNWQVDALDKRLEIQERFAARIDEKLDTLITGMVSQKQYEDRLALMEKTWSEQLKSAVREIHLQYAPMARNITWLTRTAVAAVLGIVAQLIIFFVTIRTP